MQRRRYDGVMEPMTMYEALWQAAQDAADELDATLTGRRATDLLPCPAPTEEEPTNA